MSWKLNPQDYIFPGPRGGMRDVSAERDTHDEWILDRLENYGYTKRHQSNSTTERTKKTKRPKLKITGF